MSELTYWNEARIRTSFKAFSFSLTLNLPIFTYMEKIHNYCVSRLNDLNLFHFLSIFGKKDPIIDFNRMHLCEQDQKDG